MKADMGGTWRTRLKHIVPAPVRGVLRAVYDYDQRFQLLGALRGVHQTSPCTDSNRYPAAFAQARALMAQRTPLRILSFGCSTGEEVQTLRDYFPEARLVGAEIHEQRLQACRRLGVAGDTIFIKSSPRNIAAHAPYDVIFAMAVLQRLPHLVADKGITNIARFYPFARFDRQIAAFDGWLRPGGLIVVQFTQYRFCDTAVADRYEPVGADPKGASIRQFTPAGDLIENANYTDIIFRKRA
jgi:hypothetical protein